MTSISAVLLSDFNPHSHKGSDISCSIPYFFLKYFNPHSHKGSDAKATLEYTGELNISIHTPTRGVTDRINGLLMVGGISIHTPTRGVTSKGVLFGNEHTDFNPHSHKGSDDNVCSKQQDD